VLDKPSRAGKRLIAEFTGGANPGQKLSNRSQSRRDHSSSFRGGTADALQLLNLFPGQASVFLPCWRKLIFNAKQQIAEARH
jgi:hypothetical protein